MIHAFIINDNMHFNSHAHVERDFISFGDSIAEMISTHTLTWSVTITPLFASIIKSISTHTLTWSVTHMCHVSYHVHHISTHTLTWSVTITILVSNEPSEHFNSHAHVERDNLTEKKQRLIVNFNSHAHVERDT